MHPTGEHTPHPLAGGSTRGRQRRACRLAGIHRRQTIVCRFMALVQAKDPAPQRTMARELGIGESRITRVLAAAFANGRSLCADTVEASRAEFAWVSAQAREQWERSTRDGESTLTEQVADVGADTPDASPTGTSGGKRVTVQKTVQAQGGDPRDLPVMLDARDTRIRPTVGDQPTTVSGSLEVTDPRRAVAAMLGLSPDQRPGGTDAPEGH